MAIKHRIQAAKKFGHDTWNVKTRWDDHTDPGWTRWVMERRSENPEEWKRGPHEGRYLTLMLKGLKPCVWITENELHAFEPYIKSGQIVKIGVLARESSDGVSEPVIVHEIVLTLPGEEWRGRQLMKIILGESNHRKYKDPDMQDIKLGKLLGMSNTEIRYYLGR